MFTLTDKDIENVIHDFGIAAALVSFKEIERYNYEEDDPDTKQVRLIVKAVLDDGSAPVLRFKNEDDAPQKVIEAQSRFAVLLHENGIETPKVYASGGNYAREYTINGYEVVVTVEDFKEGELREVDPETARDTGELLARMHLIAEENDFHVDSEVLFNPLEDNDLVFYDSFESKKDKLTSVDSDLYDTIVRKHAELLERIEPLRNDPQYAVQGDISDCNLYRTKEGTLGVFDFNRSGDNNLFFDAVMQAFFEARLMDYPEDLAGKQEETIFAAFLEGYLNVRPFTNREKAVFPYLYALIDAFWGVDMKWVDKSHTKTVKEADDASIRQWMREIYRRETDLGHTI